MATQIIAPMPTKTKDPSGNPAEDPMGISMEALEVEASAGWKEIPNTASPKLRREGLLGFRFFKTQDSDKAPYSVKRCREGHCICAGMFSDKLQVSLRTAGPCRFLPATQVCGACATSGL